jgi:excisionase family DNA binding protein
MNQLETIDTFAQKLNMSPHTIRAWIAQHRLGYVKLGAAIRIPTSEIERLVKSGFTPAREEGGSR